MNKIFLDTETTGLLQDGVILDNEPHIVELAWIITDADAHPIQQSQYPIRPDGWTIPESAIKIHGITNELARAIGVPIQFALSQLMNDIVAHQVTEILTYNTEFDLGMLKVEYQRLGWNDVFGLFKLAATDMMKECAYTHNAGKWMSLDKALATVASIAPKRRAIGTDYHSALEDAEAVRKLWIALFRKVEK